MKKFILLLLPCLIFSSFIYSNESSKKSLSLSLQEGRTTFFFHGQIEETNEAKAIILINDYIDYYKRYKHASTGIENQLRHLGVTVEKRAYSSH